MSKEAQAARYFLDYLAELLGIEDVKTASESVSSRIEKILDLYDQLREDKTLKKLAAKLTYQRRQALPDSAFAIPEKRKYPIHDLAHARNALARVAAFGTPEEKRRVYAAIRKRWPELWRRHVERQKRRGRVIK